MVGYIDNDFLFKICNYSIFEEFKSEFNIKEDEIRVLNSAKYVLNNLQYNKEVKETINNVISKVGEISSLENDSNYKILISKIDVGEALLISSLINEKTDYLFFTGDKQCLEKINEIKNIINPIYEKLKNKVICLEEAILRILINEKTDFTTIIEKISKLPFVDKSIRCIFGNPICRENVIAGLKSYLKDLKSKTGDLLNTIV